VNGFAVSGLRLAVGSFASLIYRVPCVSGGLALSAVARMAKEDRSRSFPL
jgi:hypothetical protein